MSLTGHPDGPPYRAGISVFDVMTGLHSTIGILAALHHRDLTGEGQHVETNLLSSALSALVNQTSAYVAGGVVPARMGNAHLSLFPYEPLQTGDGELIIIAGNDSQFRKLAAAIGRPELADDPRFDTVGKRNDNRERAAAALAGGAVGDRARRTGSASSPRPDCRAGRSTRSQAVCSSPSSSDWNRSCRSATTPFRRCATRSGSRDTRPAIARAAGAGRARRRCAGLARPPRGEAP